MQKQLPIALAFPSADEGYPSEPAMDLWTNTPWKHYDPDDMNSVEELVQGTKFTDTEYMTGYRLAFWEDQGYI